MVVVTQRAKEALLQLKRSANLEQPNIGFRLTPSVSGDLKLVADTPKAGDQIVEHGGSTVLLIDKTISEALSDAKVDCRDAVEGQLEFVMSKPRHGGGEVS